MVMKSAVESFLVMEIKIMKLGLKWLNRDFNSVRSNVIR